MAWGIVTAVLPSLSVSKHMGLSAVLVFLWSTSLVFVRTAFFDILDMQGDRIVGKETLPILMGEKQALRLLKIMLVINISMLLISGIFHFISILGFALAICPVFIFIVIYAHEQGYMLPGTRLEFLVETNFITAGAITLVWYLFS